MDPLGLNRDSVHVTLLHTVPCMSSFKYVRATPALSLLNFIFAYTIRTGGTVRLLGKGWLCAVKDLLQMLAGSAYSENRDALNWIFTEQDPVAYAASFPQAFRPGTTFNYSTVNYALLHYMLRPATCFAFPCAGGVTLASPAPFVRERKSQGKAKHMHDNHQLLCSYCCNDNHN